jgi:hypothetical protein
MDQNMIDKAVKWIFDFLGKKVTEEVQKPVQTIKVVQNEEKPAPQATIVDQKPISEPIESTKIDWADPKSKITARFSVGEALTLQSWGVMHVPSEDEKAAIVSIAQGVGRAADELEKQLGRHVSINVHAFMRPEKANIPGSQWDGHDYNRYIYETQVWKGLSAEEMAKKTVPKSPHRTGHAIDFHIVGFEGAEGCAKIRQMLLPKLEELGLRMEDLNGGWVHLDNLPVVNKRFFKP